MSFAQRLLATLLLPLASQLTLLAAPETAASKPAPSALLNPALLSQLARTGMPLADRSQLAPLFSSILDLPNADTLTPDHLVILAYAQLQCDDRPAATRTLRAITRIERTPPVCCARALLLSLLVDDKELVEHFQNRLASDPVTSRKNTASFEQLASLVILGKDVDARALIDASIAQQPSYAQNSTAYAALNFMASKALERNDRTAAISCWNASVAILQNSSPQTNRAFVHFPLTPPPSRFSSLNEGPWVGPNVLPLTPAPVQIAALDLSTPELCLAAARTLDKEKFSTGSFNFHQILLRALLHDGRPLDAARYLQALDSANLITPESFPNLANLFTSTGTVAAARLQLFKPASPLLRAHADALFGPPLVSRPGGIPRDPLLDKLRTAYNNRKHPQNSPLRPSLPSQTPRSSSPPHNPPSRPLPPSIIPTRPPSCSHCRSFLDSAATRSSAPSPAMPPSALPSPPLSTPSSRLGIGPTPAVSSWLLPQP